MCFAFGCDHAKHSKINWNNMDKTFLFYDIETTGLNPCFDQILQFAAIRTDTELNELERHEFLVQLNPDVTPSPEAMSIHGISTSDLENGISEYEAIQIIHKLVNQPGTTSLGYNTLGFDDEFLRFSFYRNLLPPYTHQYANFCGRADIYPIAIMYFLYKNNVLTWPEINGKISLKLEKLNEINQFTEGAAHDALVDVKATLELSKQLSKEIEMWRYLLGFFNKKTDSERLAKLTNGLLHHNQALWIDGSVGAKHNFQCPVLCLGQHRHYQNQTLWLRLDKPELVETTANHIPETTWVYRKKLGETGILLPTSDRFMQQLSPERQAIMTANKSWLKANLPLFNAIVDYYLEYKYPTVERLDVDAALYETGFPTPYEEQLCQSFHRATPQEKAKLIDQFQNPNMRERAIRVMGRHFREYLPDKYLSQFEDYLDNLNTNDPNQVFCDYRGQPRKILQSC